MPSLEELIMGSIAQGTKLGAEGAQQRQKADLDAARQAQEIAQAQALRKQYGNDANIGVGGIHIGAKDPLSALLRQEQMRNLQDERSRKAIQDIEDRATKAGTAQIVPGLQRGEEAIPGLFTSEKNVPLKSVGGIKTLAPDFAVPLLEKAGIMPKGASKERTALQELKNVKIYDSSGKQINENEMKRIETAMGLKGIFGAEEIIPALRQMGYTTLEKQKQVSAGAEPRALEEFKRRGGLAGHKDLPSLLGTQNRSVASESQNPLDIQDPVERLKALRAKHKK